ncbi:hypothetical protein [Saccharopolyspora sp. NPDC002686]|uniref:hypothetical protein n=1 Tax=Saccharopolyspora sp. NPDC002686 TaxID=3154541 RepID=UPI00332065CA
MNAIGACKEVMRGHDPVADGLLSRGFQRINAPDPGGDWPDRIIALARAVSTQTPELTDLTNEIINLATDLH